MEGMEVVSPRNDKETISRRWVLVIRRRRLTGVVIVIVVVVDIAEDGAEETVPSGLGVALKESSKFSQLGLALFAYPLPWGRR